MALGIKKVSMDLCVFSSQVLFLIFFGSIELYFCQRGIQPNITVMLWGTGKSTTDFYKRAYGDDVLLF